jgi:deoxyribonuclease-4
MILENKVLLGSYVSLKKLNLIESLETMKSYNATSLMFYIGPPTSSNREDINNFKKDETYKYLKNNNITSNQIVVHAPYIVNLASESPEKREFAINFLKNEVISSSILKAKNIVLHPGNFLTNTLSNSISLISEAINIILDLTKELDVTIALETMSGKGTEVGRTFEEIKEIIDLIKNKERIGVCLDTCHIFEAGYDIVNNYEEVIGLFDKIIGLKYLKVIHLNDSKNYLNAHKDRHENIGLGGIGFNTLLKFIYDPRFSNIPKILETPFTNKDYPPYPVEIEMLLSKKFDINTWNKYLELK